jgi:hypothetical protein
MSEHSTAELTLQVPVAIPSAERMEEIYREACREVIEKRATWFDFKGAADYLRISLRTFERRKAGWGLPIAELSSGIKIVFRADLDALALAHLVKGRARNLIAFPSVDLQQELAKKGAA